MSGEKRPHAGRHARAFAFLRVVMGPILRLLFRYSGERIPDVGGPMLLLCNHNTDLDCILLGMSAPKRTYFVAAESVTRMGLLGRLVLFFFDPILHEKGLQGTKTTRELLSRIRAGYHVALFPEGNRSFDGVTCPIPPVVGKLARLSGATLVTYRMTGGYLTTPRWGRGVRRGRMEGRVMGVYSAETLKAMTAAEVQTAIERDLYTDAYAEQAAHPVRFRSRRSAEYLESLLFLCPDCGAPGTLRSRGNELRCACGSRLTYTEYGLLRGEDGTERTLTELHRAQRLRLAELAAAAGEKALFSDRVTLRRFDASHRVVEERAATLCAYGDRLTAGDLTIPKNELDGVAVVQRNRLLFYANGGTVRCEAIGSPAFNALKYLCLYSDD